MTGPVAAFLRTVAGLAAALKLPVLIVVRDADRQVHFVGTPGALANMQPEIAQKIGATDDEAVTGWDG